MSCVSAILGVWLSLAAWYQDVGDSPAERTALYRPVAEAICRATSKTTERAYLAAQAYHETKLARYVLEDRCSDGPPGARCDGGKATGPWQVHGHCKAAWSGAERLEAGARCALRSGAWGLHRWKDPAGWFQAQRGISREVKPWAHARVPLKNQILARMRLEQ